MSSSRIARKSFSARKTIKRPGVMNRLELEYSLHLEALRESGEVLDWGYEPLKLRLADKTFYTPDFMVLTAQCEIELHEVKAAWKTKDKQTHEVSFSPHVEQASSIKIKLAAEAFPFTFKMVWRLKDLGWQCKVI